MRRCGGKCPTGEGILGGNEHVSGIIILSLHDFDVSSISAHRRLTPR